MIRSCKRLKGIIIINVLKKSQSFRHCLSSQRFLEGKKVIEPENVNCMVIKTNRSHKNECTNEKHKSSFCFNLSLSYL
jgi:hypothetical protein